MDLDPDDARRGPFLVVQSVILPDDPLQEEVVFVLRRDGVWVEYLTYANKPFEARGQICFDHLGDVTRLLESLPPEARIERATLPPERLAALTARMNQAGGPLAFLHHEVEQVRASRRRPN